MIRVVPLAADLPLTSRVRAALVADNVGDDRSEVTHALVDEAGTIWGGFCMAYAPVLMLWLDGQRVGPSATLAKHRAIRAVEAFYAAAGHTRILLTLHADSALYPFAGRGGYQLLGACELFAKDLTQPNPLHHVRPILQTQDPAACERASGEC
jgi:hypothetical protein